MSTYGEFDLNGWHFKAEMPDSVEEPQYWRITVTNPDGDTDERIVPMIYAPIFGPDVGDVATLNDAIEKLIKEYAIES